MSETGTSVPTTIDAFLGGRVAAAQPAAGHHRSGLEAVLLGAALDADGRGPVVDLGAGAGIAGFCAASRCPSIEVILAERDPVLAGCAREALGLPANHAFAGRVRVAEIDITAPETERITSGLPREGAAAVLTNPPFHDAASVTASPAAGRAAAHVLETQLDAWFRAAAWTCAPGGILVAVLPPSALPDLMAALAGRFGGAELLPVHSRAGDRAERLLVRARKGSRAPTAILPGLVVHEADGGAFTPALEAVLRDGAGLGDVHPPWRSIGANPS